MMQTEYLKHSIERLALAGIDNPSLDARLLFCHTLCIDRAQLLSQSEYILTTDEITAINALISRREKRESVGRIIGHREFWGLNFSLNEATLEPRPDSETLIETVLAQVQCDTALRILDLGTGTGCLLLSLLHELPQATGLGIDIAPRAVEQATQNAESLQLDQRAAFRQGNWLEGVTDKFDIIISNPPYIPGPYIPALMPEVRDYDPMLALDGGVDGLAPYRLLIPQLPNFLNPNGLVTFEVGVTQAPLVADLFMQSSFQNIATHKDLGGIERCVMATMV